MWVEMQNLNSDEFISLPKNNKNCRCFTYQSTVEQSKYLTTLINKSFRLERSIPCGSPYKSDFPSSKVDWLFFSLMTKNLPNFHWILKTKDNFQSVRTNMPVKPHLVLSRPRLACLPSPHTNIKTKCRQNKTR